MSMTYVRKNMAKCLLEHELTEECNAGGVRVFRMSRPATREFCVQLAFTREGIFLMGDLCLGRDQGGIGTRGGHGLAWFQKELSEDYLCGKFLTKQWQLRVAAEDVAGRLSDAEQELEEGRRELCAEHGVGSVADLDTEAIDEADELSDCLREVEQWRAVADSMHDESTERCLHEAADKAGIVDFWDYGIGWDYPRADAGWLCAIQQRFVALSRGAGGA